MSAVNTKGAVIIGVSTVDERTLAKTSVQITGTYGSKFPTTPLSNSISLYPSVGICLFPYNCVGKWVNW